MPWLAASGWLKEAMVLWSQLGRAFEQGGRNQLLQHSGLLKVSLNDVL